MEYGVITCARRGSSGVSGFLAVLDADGNQTRDRVFFHFDDGRVIEDNGVEPAFGSNRESLVAPRQGDILVFVRAGGDPRGPKAMPWGYANHWNQRREMLAGRPVYRVLRRRQDLSTNDVVWQGQNIFELSVKHPRRLAQDERGHVSAVSGPIASGYIFEVLRDGHWHPCHDPRTVICCVPHWIFKLYAPSGMTQGYCPHR